MGMCKLMMKRVIFTIKASLLEMAMMVVDLQHSSRLGVKDGE
jgi:hypothetical protein